MPKAIIIIFIVLLLIYLSTKLFNLKSSSPKTLTQNIKNQTFTLEIADNPFMLAKGLSGRQSLCANCGMVFIFQGESIRSFWMKNTLIPIDMIFLNQAGKITDIYTVYPEPGKSDSQLTIYQSTQAATYVIELNSGTSEKLGLKKDDILNLNINR